MIGRDEAAREAARELSRGIYGRGTGGLGHLLLSLLQAGLRRLLGGGGGHGGIVGALLATAALVLVVLLAIGLRHVGLVRRTVRGPARPVLDGPVTTAAGLRAAAAAAQARGDFSAAVVLDFRALVADLDERDVLHPAPGTTAAEVAAAAALLLGVAGEPVRAAAAVFGAVSYGYLSAGPEDAALVRAAEAAVRS